MLNILPTRWQFWKPRPAPMTEAAICWTALVICVLSGSTFNAYAKVLTTAFSSLSLLFVSEVLTAFFVLFSFGFLPVVQKILHMHRKDAVSLLFVGLLNGIAGPFLLFWGLSTTTAVNAGFYTHMQTVFIVFLAVFILREKLTSSKFS